MADFAPLEIAIDSSAARKAADDLDALKRSADTTASSVDQLQQSADKLRAPIDNIARSNVADTLDRAAKSADAAADSIGKVSESTSEVADSLGTAGDAAAGFSDALSQVNAAPIAAVTDTVDKLADASASASESVDEMATAVGSAADALGNLASTDPSGLLDDAAAASQEVSSAFDSVAASAGDMADGFTFAGQGVGAFADTMGELPASFEDVGTASEAAQSQVKIFGEEAKTASTGTDKLGESVEKLGHTVSQLGSDIAANPMSKVGSDVGGVGGAFDEAAQHVNGFGHEMDASRAATMAFRDTVHVLDPALREMGVSVGILSQYVFAARAGIIGLGIAITAGAIAGFAAMQDEVLKAKQSLDNLLGSGAATDAAFQGLTAAAHATGTEVGNLVAPFTNVLYTLTKLQTQSGVVFAPAANGLSALNAQAIAFTQTLQNYQVAEGKTTAAASAALDQLTAKLKSSQQFTLALFQEIEKDSPLLAAALAKAFTGSGGIDGLIKFENILAKTPLPLQQLIAGINQLGPAAAKAAADSGGGFANLTQSIDTTWQSVKRLLESFGAGTGSSALILQMLKNLNSAFSDAAKGYDELSRVISAKGIWNTIVAGAADAAASLLKVNVIWDRWQVILGPGGLPLTIFDLIKSNLDTIISKAEAAARALGNLLPGGSGSGLQPGQAQNTGDPYGSAGPALTTSAKAAISKDTAVGNLTDWQQYFAQLADAEKRASADASSQVQSDAATSTSAIGALWNALKGWVTSDTSDAAAAATANLTKISDAASNIPKKTSEAIEATAEEIANGLEGAARDADQDIETETDTVAHEVESAWEQANKGIIAAFDRTDEEVARDFETMSESANQVPANITRSFANVGAAIEGGVASGVNGAIGQLNNLVRAAQAAAQAASEAANAAGNSGGSGGGVSQQQQFGEGQGFDYSGFLEPGGVGKVPGGFPNDSYHAHLMLTSGEQLIVVPPNKSVFDILKSGPKIQLAGGGAVTTPGSYTAMPVDGPMQGPASITVLPGVPNPGTQTAGTYSAYTTGPDATGGVTAANPASGAIAGPVLTAPGAVTAVPATPGSSLVTAPAAQTPTAQGGTLYGALPPDVVGTSTNIGATNGSRLDAGITTPGQAVLDLVTSFREDFAKVGIGQAEARRETTGAGNNVLQDVIRYTTTQIIGAMSINTEKLIAAFTALESSEVAAITAVGASIDALGSSMAASAAASASASTGSGSTVGSDTNPANGLGPGFIPGTGRIDPSTQGIPYYAKGGAGAGGITGVSSKKGSDPYGLSATEKLPDSAYGYGPNGQPIQPASQPYKPIDYSKDTPAYAVGSGGTKTPVGPMGDSQLSPQAAAQASAFGADYNPGAGSDTAFAEGGDIVVPKGFPDDTFKMPLHLSSDERVRITKGADSNDGQQDKQQARQPSASPGVGGQPTIVINIYAQDAASVIRSKAQIAKQLSKTITDEAMHR